jgi:prepilin-type processing-associated H-X9-DG protein
MAGVTLAEAQEQLAFWLKASKAVASSQSYTIHTENSSRSLTRAEAEEIRAQIIFWDGHVKRLSRGGLRVHRITIDDD